MPRKLLAILGLLVLNVSAQATTIPQSEGVVSDYAGKLISARSG